LLSLCLSLGHVPFFSRSSVKELIVFGAREVSSRVTQVKTAVRHGEYTIHLHMQGDLILTLVSLDLNPATASSLLSTSLPLIISALASLSLPTVCDGATDAKPLLPLPVLHDVLTQANDAASHPSSVAAVQADVDEVASIMIRNIDDMLAAGESIDSLVDKSDDLAAQSKVFAKQSRDLHCKLRHLCILQ